MMDLVLGQFKKLSDFFVHENKFSNMGPKNVNRGSQECENGCE